MNLLYETCNKNNTKDQKRITGIRIKYAKRFPYLLNVKKWNQGLFKANPLIQAKTASNLIY